MRFIIDYIRSCFCNHDWECLMEAVPVYDGYYSSYPAYYKWVYICKKCKCKKIVKSR